MIDAQFEAALDLIHQGAGRAPLQRLITVAQHIARVPIAYLVVRNGNEDRIIVSDGIPHIPLLVPRPAGEHTAFLFDRPHLIDDLSRDDRLCREPLVVVGGWRWLATMPLPMPMRAHRVALVCADLRDRRPATHDVLERLSQLAGVIVDELQMLGLLARQLRPQLESTNAFSQPHVPAQADLSGDSPSVVTDFLLDTLVDRHRVLTRAQTSYHALVTWRTPIKDAQLTALRALKRDPPQKLVARVGERLAAASRQLFDAVPQTVVAVPCGNSGDVCLARRLAVHVAGLLGVAHCDAFAPIEVSGSSHPRRNAARPTMKLVDPPRGPVLLIDDVATSGSHLAEASAALRSVGTPLFALVWLGG